MSESINRTRVLHIITRFIPGGADENTRYTVDGLDAQKYKVDLMVGGESDLQFANSVSNGRVILEPHLVRELHPLRDLWALIKIARLIRKERYHIVHTHTAKAGILGRLAGLISRTPAVLHTLHGTTFHDSMHPTLAAFYRLLERAAARITSKLVTVSDDLRELYLNAGIGKADRYITIRSGIDLNRFLVGQEEILRRNYKVRGELGLKESDVVVGTASRLELRKGHIYFLQAAEKILRKYPVRFIIAGDGPAAPDIRKMAREFNIDKSVMFLGHRKDIEDVICALDIFVLTSLWEGLPRVLVQAAALGKPIVTFDVEGAREVIHQNKSGFIVPLRDVEKLVESIAYLIDNPKKARIMGSWGRTIVNGEWDKDVMVRKISHLYDELLEKGNICV